MNFVVTTNVVIKRVHCILITIHIALSSRSVAYRNRKHSHLISFMSFYKRNANVHKKEYVVLPNKASPMAM